MIETGGVNFEDGRRGYKPRNTGGRLRSGFGLSNPSQRVRDWEGGAWATMLKAADCSGPWRETGIGVEVEVKTLSRAWRAHRTRKVKSHAQFFIHSTN